MNRIETFQQFLTTQSAQIPVLGFVLNLIMTAILAYILGRIYTRYGTALSNRKMFAKNFIMISTTTMLIIAIVKSSLALSLGLVGALSIVRFRAAIKEPEELAYLFLAIAIGLGFGADQAVITIVAFIVMYFIIILRERYHGSESDKNLYLTISSQHPNKLGLKEITDTLKKYCAEVEIKRLDETADVLEGTFLLSVEEYEQFQQAKNDLQQKNKDIHITFLDNKGIL